MADYTQTTDFSAKDALPTGQAAKVIKGSEMDAELDAISSAISSKAENAANETISGNWTHTGTTTFSNTVTGILPAGMVVPFAGTTSPPSGWLTCDGTAVSRTTYADLFAAIGTQYGVGDGSTTFNLPDITGRVIAGKESSETRITTATAGFSGATLGAAGGDQRLHAHSHTGVMDATISAEGGANNRAYNQNRVATGTTGGGNSQNVQPTIILHYIIKT